MGRQDAETLPAVGHPAMFSDCMFLRSGQVGLRSWLPELYRPLSKLHRLKLQGALEEAVVVKRTKSHSDSCLVSFRMGVVLRQGGPGLKATQAYPAGFGTRLRRLHTTLKDCFQFGDGDFSTGEEGPSPLCWRQSCLRHDPKAEAQACWGSLLIVFTGYKVRNALRLDPVELFRKPACVSLRNSF